MKCTGRYNSVDSTEEERLDNEMQEEIDMQRERLLKFISNVDSLLGKKRANEVYRNMIYTLTESIK